MPSSLLERPVSARPFSADRFLSERFSADLVVQRTDINFSNIAPGRVRISIKVTNCGKTRSQPTPMLLQAAPLGTFLPWSNLTALLVPSIEPGESIEVATEVSTPPTKPLGEFSRVPPQKLLTAIGSEDEPEPRLYQQSARQPQQQIVTAWRDFFGRLFGKKSNEQPLPTLPDDPHELLMRPNIHWAGNINILIGQQAVERHLAQSLRIYPGRTNLALFFVGHGRDEYQFELTGSGAAWEAVLFGCNSLPNFVAARSVGQPIPRSKWVPLDGRHMILLALCPPASCAAGSVNIHVRQRSTNRDAIVEFSLDPNAAGAGCYTV